MKQGKVKKDSAGRIQDSSKVKLLNPKSRIPNAVLVWYDQHRRILPWRALSGSTIDPYRVWLSEIMLQQTTVGTVGPYFQKFITRWPTLQHLARAKTNDILKMWAGLGYYRRAHLLHECAKAICRDYGGQFPETENELIELPGFGAYTAAAVAAIAFGNKANVVDGNVERVMARLFAIETPLPAAKPELRAAAAKLLPESRFGDYAQALMDLGATICTPRNPKCTLCPISKSCRARAKGIAEALPRRMKNKTKPMRRAIAFFAMDNDGNVLVRERPKNGLLGGMTEIPSTEWLPDSAPELSETSNAAPLKANWKLLDGHVRHVFTHFELEMQVAATTKLSRRHKVENGRWVPLHKLEGEALPSIMRKIVKHAESKLFRT